MIIANSYPKRTRRIIVKYLNMLQPTEDIYIYECNIIILMYIIINVTFC